jgi:competence protein ComGC
LTDRAWETDYAAQQEGKKGRAMYKVIGTDGNHYGPISLEQLRQWIAEGRVNAQTQVQEADAVDWKTAAEFPELGFAPAGGIPGAGPLSPPPLAGQTPTQQNGLAITSFVLGLLSLVCFGFLSGIPAIICGHLARARARRSPGQYGGEGFALAGLIMGYVGLVVTLVILPALLLPALSRAKSKAQEISCRNNLKMIGLSFRTWAIDNDGNYPFNLSTNKGGTMELSAQGIDGFDINAARIFQVMSNELSTPKVLICPADSKRQPALDFQSLQPANVSYRVRSGTNVNETNPEEVLALCPIHNNVLLSDGSVQTRRKARR